MIVTRQFLRSVLSRFTPGLLLLAMVFLAMIVLTAAERATAQSRFATKKGTPSANKKAPAKGTGTPAESSSASEGSEAASTPTEIVIHRQPLHIRPPERYQIGMHLEPSRTVRLAAASDGTVKSILHKPGEKLQSGTEVVHLDLTEKQMLLERAKALYKAAQLEAQQAAGGSGGSIAKQIAEARLDAAKADLDLAQFRVEQGSVRVPFNAEVLRVAIDEGQLVRAGETLVTVGDTATLKVEMPVDRNVTAPGQNLQVKVEDRTVSGKVESVLPLAPRFESLRELVPSIASAVVLIDDAGGRLKAGQTVFSTFIPRDPVTEVANSCISNVPDGTHKVQVLRDNVVRDVPITALATIGADRSFISGAFDSKDELIVSASQELPDGTVVRSAQAAAQEIAKPGASSGPKGTGTQSPPETPRAGGI